MDSLTKRVRSSSSSLACGQEKEKEEWTPTRESRRGRVEKIFRGRGRAHGLRAESEPNATMRTLNAAPHFARSPQLASGASACAYGPHSHPHGSPRLATVPAAGGGSRRGAVEAGRGLKVFSLSRANERNKKRQAKTGGAPQSRYNAEYFPGAFEPLIAPANVHMLLSLHFTAAYEREARTAPWRTSSEQKTDTGESVSFF